jgi:beta-phosphoglucomutase-like phosphatase (HAD superfamily)
MLFPRLIEAVPTGILPRFDAVIACDDYARGKPHPTHSFGGQKF